MYEKVTPESVGVKSEDIKKYVEASHVKDFSEPNFSCMRFVIIFVKTYC